MSYEVFHLKIQYALDQIIHAGPSARPAAGAGERKRDDIERKYRTGLYSDRHPSIKLFFSSTLTLLSSLFSSTLYPSLDDSILHYTVLFSMRE